MIDQQKSYCPICDCIEGDSREECVQEDVVQTHKENEEMSFAVLLALVPAMTMTLFNLMGLI